MNTNKEFVKNKIYIDSRKESGVSAFYVDLLLTKSFEIFEYVDVKRDETVFTIERQNINPYYIGFDFFNSTSRIKINSSKDLTEGMIEYLRANYANEIIHGEYGIEKIGELDMVFLSANPTHFAANRIALFINQNYQQATEPPSKKFRLSGSGVYDGTYICTGCLKEQATSIIKAFVCVPYQHILPPFDVVRVTSYGWWNIANLNANTAKIQVIKDSLNTGFDQAVSGDKNWDVKVWFDNVGYNKLTLEKDKETGETGIDKLEKIEKLANSVVSKAYFFPITINK